MHIEVEFDHQGRPWQVFHNHQHFTYTGKTAPISKPDWLWSRWPPKQTPGFGSAWTAPRFGKTDYLINRSTP
jgi:hypothetical protein